MTDCSVFRKATRHLRGGPWHGKEDLQRDAQRIRHMDVGVPNGIRYQGISLQTRPRLGKQVDIKLPTRKNTCNSAVMHTTIAYSLALCCFAHHAHMLFDLPVTSCCRRRRINYSKESARLLHPLMAYIWPILGGTSLDNRQNDRTEGPTTHLEVSLGVFRVWLRACIQLPIHISFDLLPQFADLPKPTWENTCNLRWLYF